MVCLKSIAILSAPYVFFALYPLYFRRAFAVTLTGIINRLLAAPSIYHCVVLSLYTNNRNILYSAERSERE